MKRLIIEGDWRESDYMWSNSEGLCVSKHHVTRVEDVPEPLPTEPGTRFWGRTDNTDPQWWFVQKILRITFYNPAIGDSIGADRTEDYGLIRLPDPDGDQ